MLTRSRPAARRSSATRRNVAPLVVIDRSGLPTGERRRRRGRHAQLGELGDEHRQVGAHRRLAAGEAQTVDLEALDEEAGEPLDLLERQHLAARQPLHALFRHAVGAAEVAAVGDRDAQVANGASEGIDEIHCPRLTGPYRTRGGSCRPRRRRRQPSPSGTIDHRVGQRGGRQLMAALGADTGLTWYRPSSPNDAIARM